MDKGTLVKALSRKKAEAAQAEAQSQANEREFIEGEFYKIATAIATATSALTQFLKEYEGKTEVTNLPSSIRTPDIVKVAAELKKLVSAVKPKKQDNSDVVAGLGKLETAVKAIPAPVSSVTVENIGDIALTLENAVKELSASVAKLQLSPKITVPKPTVTVQKTDMKPVVEALNKVKQAVDDKPVPGTTVVQTDPLIRFTPANMDEASDTIQYYSYIAATGEYYIRKVDRSGSYDTIRFFFGSGGSSAHDSSWTDRASLTYTMWSQ